LNLFFLQVNQEIIIEKWTPVLVNGCDLKITGYIQRYVLLYSFCYEAVNTLIELNVIHPDVLMDTK
jgi:hypothetical protein